MSARRTAARRRASSSRRRSRSTSAIVRLPRANPTDRHRWPAASGIVVQRRRGVSGRPDPRWARARGEGRVTTASQSAARERVLDVAERLFSERGYKAVTLRDIAEELGIRQASLYHHAPGGKEQLFLEVTERGLARHRAGLERAIAEAAPDLRARLRAVARWLLAQPPVDLARLVRSDLPALSPEHEQRLVHATVWAILLPIQHAFREAREREGYRVPNDRLLAGTFLSIIESIQIAERFTDHSPERMADAMIDVLVDGLRPR
ncbi:MAG: TetR/AcrR family transcriptional regulator [Thermomicrobiaceae bacterium]|nr:TetR/AcrR family transcriptional regulator [Thermomicrobiaceae bacterium]